MKTHKILLYFCVIFLVSTASFGTDDDFYDVIVKNDIFRPLGWQPPRRVIPVRLIGTILPTKTKGKRPTAILKEVGGGQKTHYVHTGDKIGDTTIIGIQPKQVTLNVAGQEVVLRLNVLYLNTSGRIRSRPPPPAKLPSLNERKISFPKKVVHVPIGM